MSYPTLPGEQHFGEEAMELCMWEKTDFILSTYSPCGTLAYMAAQHTTWFYPYHQTILYFSLIFVLATFVGPVAFKAHSLIQ